MPEKLDLRSLAQEDMTELAQKLGWPPYRARQIFAWVHKHGAQDFADLKNLPAGLRQALSEYTYIDRPQVLARRESSAGDTVKLLLSLRDGVKIEMAVLLYHRQNSRERATCCVSTQSGCVMRCAFCATALSGPGRDLSPGEIVSQALLAQQIAREKGFPALTNIVYMGMGEPLLNLASVKKSLLLFNAEEGLNIGMRRMTVSTCGIVPGIYELAAWGKPVCLAVSLHSASDETRRRLMPGAAAHPVSELMKACRHYQEKTGERVTFEYALFAGVNDSDAEARRLGALLRGERALLNLIPANFVAETGFSPSGVEKIKDFSGIVASYGVEVSAREPRGADIDAACGQLRGKYVENSDKA
ncbi:MAG: 23S rRNA (adenine(2503)-C(2))-methyltransferase RlmN [Clostridiales bacterium]|nr:23S rRNA (adenine(2503)-C(2))-methyltransferase RlmN [Clostridiales bacterium]